MGTIILFCLLLAWNTSLASRPPTPPSPHALIPPSPHAPTPLLWTDPAGRPTPDAREALALLRDAAADGLDPDDYGAAALTTRADVLARGPAPGSPPPAAADIAAFDADLTEAMLTYFRHLHLGRVDPRAAGFQLTLPAEGHDFVQLLGDAIARKRVGETARELWPPLGRYRALRDALPKYRALAAEEAAWPAWPAARKPVKPGDAWDGLPALHHRLVRLGDLPADAPAPAGDAPYEGALVDGVLRFQQRHGLEPDGVIGRATHAALRVPIAWRARQIELALERLRWMPDLGPGRTVILNIPMFRLWALDAPDAAPALTMRAIVGRALKTTTPVFADEIQYLIFRPYWNIPRSILVNEVLPAVNRNPGYLARNDMEIVRGESDGSPAVAATAENLALLAAGRLRLRQRPGEQNALGRVKFVFPNDSSVYLHDTPARTLFARSRRDFSHGCVRLEEPAALATWALKDQPGWDEAAVLAAMEGAPSRRVDLAQAIQVILFYVTAMVFDADGGAVHFADDIYRHDVRLDRVLTPGG